ncbi:MAG: hypothetical protein ACKO4M_07060 [Betaproteobacteria bacterium]
MCALCGQHNADLLCEPCQQRYASNASVRCPRCAITLTTQRLSFVYGSPALVRRQLLRYRLRSADR